MLEIKDVLISDYGTAIKFQDIVLNLYNHNTYQAPDLFGFLCNADEIHKKLLFDLLETIAKKRGDSNQYLIQLHGLINPNYREERKKNFDGL